MFNRTSQHCATALVSLASLSLLAGCGLIPGDSGDGGGKISVGTTSSPVALDPALSWDNSWELFRNVFQTLLSFPTGSTVPEPDAAEVCEFTDSTNTVLSCRLREGLKFSNGDEVDAAAVKYSIDRIRKINEPGGPAGLLGSLDKIETKGALEVLFRLKKPDVTFPFVLATPAMSIVPPAEYPQDRARDDGKITGSGPYTLKSYEKHDRAELAKYRDYKGFADRKNDAVVIRYFDESEAMVKALKDGRIDATYRGLTAEEVVALRREQHDGEINVVDTVGLEIRYLVFNPAFPGPDEPAVRRAIAQVVNRDALVDRVYRGTAEPLYSMVPKGIVGHTPSFFDTYGEPDAKEARRILRQAGVTAPVKLTFWYTTDRYGSSTAREFAELKRQLDGSGLFEITLRSKPWDDFQKSFNKGEFPVFGRGWFPDFPDPDNFIAPFVGDRTATGTPYRQDEITRKLLPRSRGVKDRGAVAEGVVRAQEILVKDVRLLPLWQGKMYVAVAEDIAGAERSLDPQSVMQMWELSRKTSW
ncbi:ABC transporter substrate-binding protein [Streptomyces sp. NPDC050504]|uniref:ABC transporter substrate-binding protein n=1 Tax=Streptomyces sp. NPDC050504 TaxID=3365618 RepID=UPI00378F12FB